MDSNHLTEFQAVILTTLPAPTELQVNVHTKANDRCLNRSAASFKYSGFSSHPTK